MYHRLTLLFVTTIGLFGSTFAQSTTTTVDANVQVTYAQYLGEIPPVRELVPLSPTTDERRKQSKLSKQAPRNFVGRERRPLAFPEQPRPDALRQPPLGRNGLVIEPSVNIEGLFNGGSPHDPSGDIGRDHYLQAINVTQLGVFDKQGNLIQSFAANTLWSTIGFSSAGDPIILYDQAAERWLITEFPNGNQLLIAVSQTADPMGAYDAYNFATPSFPDYPKYAIWDNAYHVTTNEGGGGTLHSYFIDRTALLAGEDQVSIQRIGVPGNTGTEQGFFVSTPVDWTGLTPPDSDPIVMALHDSTWDGINQDAVELYTFDLNFDDPDSTVVTNTRVNASPYDAFACSASGFGFACIPQQGGGGLDGVPEVIMNQPHYRNFGTHESLVYAHMTDVDGNNFSGIRWAEMRRTNGGDWTMHQEGTYSPDNRLHRFMPTICMDGNGNIGLGYNVSSEDSFAGVRYTGRRAGDAPGEMTVEEFIAVEGENTIQSFGRFGDYNHMSVDPTDDRTFWFTAEYAGSGEVRTRIVAFELTRDTIDIGVADLLAPADGPDKTDAEPVSVQVTNFGLDTQSVFQVGYSVDDGPVFIESVTQPLLPDSSYAHTFGTTVDMTALGDYNFKLWTVLNGDQAVFNDTLRRVVRHLPRYDAGITNLITLSNIVCSDTVFVDVLLANFGALPLQTVQLEVQLNGNALPTTTWTGNLAQGEDEVVTLAIGPLVPGDNQLTVSTAAPNGEVDPIAINNSRDLTVTSLADGEAVTLALQLDNYPEETTWTLTDENGVILFDGGPYTESGATIVEAFCLAPDACYRFNIFDTFGDGICCQFGQGGYQLTDAAGIVLVSSNGQFSNSESTEFCPGVECLLALEADVSPAADVNSADGSILITATNANGDTEYSIDGGQSFQPSNVFDGLPGGEYTIVVNDGAGCSAEITVTVEVLVSTGRVDGDYHVAVTPNPTPDAFRVTVSGLPMTGVYLPLDLYDEEGRLVYHSRIARYDDVYTGQLSLYAFPAGVYFLRFQNHEVQRLVRIVRQ